MEYFTSMTCILLTTTPSAFSQYGQKFKKNLRCKTWDCYLGLEFLFKPEGILVTQRQYIKDILHEFGLQDFTPVSTPMVEKLKLAPDTQAPATNITRYQHMVEKLIFLSHKRPNFCLGACVVSRFMLKSQESHLQAVKHQFRYLMGTTG